MDVSRAGDSEEFKNKWRESFLTAFRGREVRGEELLKRTEKILYTYEENGSMASPYNMQNIIGVYIVRGVFLLDTGEYLALWFRRDTEYLDGKHSAKEGGDGSILSPEEVNLETMSHYKDLIPPMVLTA